MQAGFPRGLGLDVVHDPMVNPPDMMNLAHTLIQGNASEQAMELCELMAEEISKHVLVSPVGAPGRSSGS